MDFRGDGRVTTKTWLIRDVWTLLKPVFTSNPCNMQDMNNHCLCFKKMVFFCNSCPQFAKHTFHKSLHKGWFFNTLEQPCVFQKHLSVVGLPLILLLGAGKSLTVVKAWMDLSRGKKPHRHICQFLAIVSLFQGFQGILRMLLRETVESYLWTSSYLVLFNLGATHLTKWVSSWNI